VRAVALAVLLAIGALVLSVREPRAGTAEDAIRREVLAGGMVELPAGVSEIRAEIEIPAGIDGLEIRGAASGSTLRASNPFRGRAVFRCDGARRVRFANFAIDGNRAALESRSGLPGFSTPFAKFTSGNGILVVAAAAVDISNIQFSNMPGFAILVSRSQRVAIDGVRVADSGSRSPSGPNNATGGILLEEGTRNFVITHCDLREIRGNGIWTHSLASSPHNRDGLIGSNHFERIGRDAVQVGHGWGVRVLNNTGAEIGYPLDTVDMEHVATPVALDTAGDTGGSEYAGNQFSEVNGKCIDLDGFHDGKVHGNSCVNRYGAEHYPYGNIGVVFNNSDAAMRSQGIELEDNTLNGTLFSGIFVIGNHHLIARNHLARINLAHCDGVSTKFGCGYAPSEPGLLRSGIYLANRGSRPAPAQNNRIESNEISGFDMAANCINAARSVALSNNAIADNRCQDDPAQ